MDHVSWLMGTSLLGHARTVCCSPRLTAVLHTCTHSQSNFDSATHRAALRPHLDSVRRSHHVSYSAWQSEWHHTLRCSFANPRAPATHRRAGAHLKSSIAA